MPRNEREIRYRDRDRDDRPSAPRRPARPRAGRRRPSGGPHEEVFHAEGDPRAARAIGVSQPIVSKYTRDDRWEFGGGPWTATEVKEIRAWRRRHYPADDDPLAELQDLSQERRAKLQLVVERTIAVKFKNQLAAGGLLDKHEVERGRVERVAAVKAAMMAIRHLAVKMEGKGLQEREQILEDWARGVCNRFAAPDPTDPPD